MDFSESFVLFRQAAGRKQELPKGWSGYNPELFRE